MRTGVGLELVVAVGRVVRMSGVGAYPAKNAMVSEKGVAEVEWVVGTGFVTMVAS